MSETAIVIISLGAFFVFAPVVVAAVLLLLARLGGWHALAREFGVDAPPPDANATLHGLSVGALGHYSRVASCATTADALWLWLPRLLRVGHRPLRIPYTAIRWRGRNLLGQERFEVQGRDRRTIRLYGPAASELKEKLRAAE